ncbi:hypothetical protein [Pseudomonas fluorescens]|uniref:hypothetical protein n=1 Tax=Pseudomonas fluorescens TaxID=294 RepID=UPI001BE6A764|nr:hypothetical protein [Pseudomonas fluorescens]MBT2372385.1 hypothetical protein [Pseudomonas fluorescens]
MSLEKSHATFLTCDALTVGSLPVHADGFVDGLLSIIGSVPNYVFLVLATYVDGLIGTSSS